MFFQITLTSFYSAGDERRFFLGLKEIVAITDLRGVGRDLIDGFKFEVHEGQLSEGSDKRVSNHY